jgi:predicted nucleic acid-binding protein
MELIVDTNIFISAMVSDSKTREILMDSNHIFYAPEYSKTEICEPNHRVTCDSKEE